MANDLLEREEQAAGNSDDGLNVGQKNSDATFNKKEGSHDEIEGYDRSADGLDNYDEEEFGKRKDPEYTDAHGDKVKSNYNADDPTDDIKEKEETGGPSLYSGGGSGGGGGFNFQAALKGNGRNVGPSSGVIGLMIFAFLGFGGGAMGLASSLVVNIAEIFHNDRSDATRTNRIFSRAFISNKVNNTKDCAGVKIKCKMSSMSKAQFESYKNEGFKIKGDVIDKDGKNTGEQADDNKSKINDPANNDGSRVKVSEITFPDKTTATSGKDFFAHADKSIDARRTAERGFNSKSSFYQNRFFSKYLGDVFNFSKAKKAFPEDDKDKAKDKENKDKAFNEQTEGTSDEENKNGGADKRAKKITDDAEGEIKKNGKRGGGAVAALVRGYCSAYRLGLVTQAALKARLVIQMGQYALMFLQAASEIKDGRGDGPKTTYLSEGLTSYEPNKELLEDSDLGKKGDPNPKSNLTATDSEGYKIAALGDKSGLKDFSKKFMANGSGLGKKIEGITTQMASVTSVPGVSQLLGSGNTEKQKMKKFCRLVNGDIANLVSACAAVPGAVAGVSAAPTLGLGAVAGLALGVVTCTCAATGQISNGVLQSFVQISIAVASIGTINCPALEAGAEAAMNTLMGIIKSQYVLDKVADILKNLNIGSDIKGVDAGNVIAAGSSAMLSRAATGYAERPAKKGANKQNDEVSKFITYTQPLEEKYIALEKDDARLNPLDINNKYTLVGSLARSLNLGAAVPASLYGSLTTLSSIIPSSLHALTGGTASALYNQPSTANDGAGGRYNNCDGQNGDSDLQELDDGRGVTADSFCSIVGITPPHELEMATDQAYNPASTEINDLTDRMLSKTYGNGDRDDSTPSIDDNGNPKADTEYSKFLANCTEARKAPWGAQYESYETGSDSDQKWFTGDRCLEDTPMLADFRSWTNYCLQSGTMDGELNCYTEDAPKAQAAGGTCGDGSNASIYYCALPYDPWGYGPHPHGDDVGKFSSDIKAGKNPLDGSALQPGTPLIDCSGLVTLAVWDAFGIDISKEGGNHAPEDFEGGQHWEKVNQPETNAQKGDVITFSGHVEIIDSIEGDSYKTFGSHASQGGADDISPASYKMDGSTMSINGVFRFKK